MLRRKDGMFSKSRLLLLIRRWGIPAGVAAFLVIVVFCYIHVRQFVELTTWVKHTNSVLNDLGRVGTSLERAEGNQRGYLLLGNDQFLEVFKKSKKEVFENLKSLSENTKDNPTQALHLEELHQLAVQRFEKMENVLQLSQKKNISTKILKSYIDIETMPKIRSKIAELQDSEHQLLTDRTNLKEAQALRVLNFILIGVGLTMTLIVLSRYLYITAEKERKHQYSILQSILNSLGDGLVVVDQHGSLVLANPAAGKILGVINLVEKMENRAQELGFYDPKTNLPMKSNETPMARAVLHGQSLDDFEILVKNNTFPEGIIISVNSRPIITPDGIKVGALALYRDITKRKNIEAEWEQARQVAIDASRLKSEFLASMSHEIRTPMNGVIGMATLLLETRLNDDQLSYVKTIKTSADSLLSLINSILDHSRIESGKLILEKRDFNVHMVVQSVRDMFSYMSRSQSLQFNIEFDLDPNLVVYGDPDRLRQILVNLVGNAFKFTERGFVTLKVSMQFENENSHRFLVEVRDTGIGMSIEAQKKLFERFSQVHVGGKEKYGGTGLGLTIAKELVSMMKGIIEVESMPGMGTRIWFTIETEKVTPEMQKGINSNLLLQTPTSSCTAFQQLTGRILVAEDQPVNKTVVRSYLEKCGLEYEITSDGQEALLAYFNEPGGFDIILMDCQMPRMNGYEATHKIREYEKSKNLDAIPIIALTAEGRLEDREACYQVGMNDFLSKPIDLQKFNEALAHWLQVNRTSAVLDRGVLAKLSRFESDGIPLDLALINEYVKSSLPQMERLLTLKEASKLVSLAHAVKSASASIGLLKVSEICERIEYAAEENSDYSQMLNELKDAIPPAKQALESYTELRSSKAS